MKPVWERLEKLASKNDFDDYAVDLYVSLYYEPFGADIMKGKDLRKAVEDIEKKSLELADLVDTVMPYNFIEEISPKGLNTLVTHVIRRLGPQARQRLEETRILPNPNIKNAKRNYFIGKLSVYLRNTYGKPLKEIVVTISSVILDEKVSDNIVDSITRKFSCK